MVQLRMARSATRRRRRSGGLFRVLIRCRVLIAILGVARGGRLARTRSRRMCFRGFASGDVRK